MTFAFLNASSLCLLAWGLLPGRLERGSTGSTGCAALPLTGLVLVGAGDALCGAAAKHESGSSHQPKSSLRCSGQFRGRVAMVVVLLLTVFGWLLAPLVRIDVAVVGILGLLAAVATGSLVAVVTGRTGLPGALRRHSERYGLVGGLGVDRDVAAGLGASLGRLGLVPWTFVAMLVVVGALVEVALGKMQMLLVLGLALIPAAAAIGVEPWVVIITLVAGPSLWFLPGQAPLLVAQPLPEGRLYSRAQSQAVALGYALTLLAVVLSVPYWHFFLACSSSSRDIGDGDVSMVGTWWPRGSGSGISVLGEGFEPWRHRGLRRIAGLCRRPQTALYSCLNFTVPPNHTPAYGPMV
jgi:hypothetical protein